MATCLSALRSCCHLCAIQQIAQKIQRCWRGYIARRRCREQIAALTVQRVYRGREIRERLWQERHAAITLQSLCRSWLQHVVLYTHVWNISATVIQSRWRGVQTRQHIRSAMRAELEELERQIAVEVAMATKLQKVRVPVSYTHLTLPTICSV